jgi:hypothetical protein
MAKGLKTGGREKGTPNRTTREAREMLLGILEQYQDNGLEKDLEAVKPEVRLKFMSDLMKQLIPRFKPEKAEDEKDRPPSEFRIVIHEPIKDVSSDRTRQ